MSLIMGGQGRTKPFRPHTQLKVIATCVLPTNVPADQRTDKASYGVAEKRKRKKTSPTGQRYLLTEFRLNTEGTIIRGVEGPKL